MILTSDSAIYAVLTWKTCFVRWSVSYSEKKKRQIPINFCQISDGKNAVCWGHEVISNIFSSSTFQLSKMGQNCKTFILLQINCQPKPIMTYKGEVYVAGICTSCFRSCLHKTTWAKLELFKVDCWRRGRIRNKALNQQETSLRESLAKIFCNFDVFVSFSWPEIHFLIMRQVKQTGKCQLRLASPCRDTIGSERGKCKQVKVEGSKCALMESSKGKAVRRGQDQATVREESFVAEKKIWNFPSKTFHMEFIFIICTKFEIDNVCESDMRLT